MSRYLRILMLLIVVMLCLVAVNPAQAAVTLVSFDAIADFTNHKIALVWETGSELNFAGFYIERSLSLEIGYEPLLDVNGDPVFFRTQGEGGFGSQYIYDDTDIDDGVVYYYRLEMIDLSGDLYYSEVVTATLQASPTPTITSTATTTVAPETQTPTETLSPGTHTPTVTRTPIPPTPTRTKTHQPTPTRTRTPSPFHAVTFTSPPRATLTPTETSSITHTPTVSPTVTTTLAPLPSLTLLFPVHTPTPTFTPSSTVTPSPIPPTLTSTPKPDNHISLQIGFLAGIIILLWITLAGFLFVYLRRMSH